MLNPLTHPMTTRLQHGIRKPLSKLNLNAEVAIVDLPKNITQSLKNPVWRQAMDTEISTLRANKTWTVVPYSPSHNVVGC